MGHTIIQDLTEWAEETCNVMAIDKDSYFTVHLCICCVADTRARDLGLNATYSISHHVSFDKLHVLYVSTSTVESTSENNIHKTILQVG